MNKKTQKKLAKIFVLVDLLVQEIDYKDRVPTKETKAIHDKAKELQQMLEPILERFYDNNSVSSSTFFLILQNKFNYIFDKEYN
jgi:ATP adenylyltransferase/5',5'''-P-1,P-4-tetraphosphate phosphorylase II